MSRLNSIIEWTLVLLVWGSVIVLGTLIGIAINS